MKIWNITFLFVLYLVSLQHNTEDKFDLIATSLKKAKAVHTTPQAPQSSFCSHKKTVYELFIYIRKCFRRSSRQSG